MNAHSFIDELWIPAVNKTVDCQIPPVIFFLRLNILRGAAKTLAVKPFKTEHPKRHQNPSTPKRYDKQPRLF